jgi:hypothetical protein
VPGISDESIGGVVATGESDPVTRKSNAAPPTRTNTVAAAATAVSHPRRGLAGTGTANSRTGVSISDATSPGWIGFCASSIHE